jgi:hypothetical protein
MDPKGKGMVVNDKEKESLFNEPRDDKLKGKCALGPFLSILVIECQHKYLSVNLCQLMDKVQIKSKGMFLRLSTRNRKRSIWKRLGYAAKTLRSLGAPDSVRWCTGQCPVCQAGDCQLAALGKRSTAYGYKSLDCPVVHRTVR